MVIAISSSFGAETTSHPVGPRMVFIAFLEAGYHLYPIMFWYGAGGAAGIKAIECPDDRHESYANERVHPLRPNQ